MPKKPDAFERMAYRYDWFTYADAETSIKLLRRHHAKIERMVAALTKQWTRDLLPYKASAAIAIYNKLKAMRQ